MKKITISLLFTITFLLLTNFESNGQCASGFSQQTVTLSVGGCTYDLLLCYKCSPASYGEVYIRAIYKHPTTPPCSGWNDYDVLDYFYNYVNTGAFITSNLCFWSEVPPCGTGTLEIKHRFSYCWKVSLDTEYFGQPTEVLLPCDPENHCLTISRICIENGQINIVHSDYIQQGDSPNCDPYSYPVEYDECFLMYTNCNPEE